MVEVLPDKTCMVNGQVLMRTRPPVRRGRRYCDYFEHCERTLEPKMKTITLPHYIKQLGKHLYRMGNGSGTIDKQTGTLLKPKEAELKWHNKNEKILAPPPYGMSSLLL